MKNKKEIKIIKLVRKIDTLKDCLKYLKENYKYVRMIELHNTMILETVIPEGKYVFKKFMLASNELEEYEKTDEEFENINITINKTNVKMLLFEVYSGDKINIPIFILEKEKEVIKRNGKRF